MKTINLQKEIMKLNKEELDEVIVAIKNRRVALNSQAMSSFYRGMKVQFGKKNGIRRLGTIESIGRTRAVVDTGEFHFLILLKQQATRRMLNEKKKCDRKVYLDKQKSFQQIDKKHQLRWCLWNQIYKMEL